MRAAIPLLALSGRSCRVGECPLSPSADIGPAAGESAKGLPRFSCLSVNGIAAHSGQVER
jgi:hypothetical protein